MSRADYLDETFHVKSRDRSERRLTGGNKRKNGGKALGRGGVLTRYALLAHEDAGNFDPIAGAVNRLSLALPGVDKSLAIKMLDHFQTKADKPLPENFIRTVLYLGECEDLWLRDPLDWPEAGELLNARQPAPPAFINLEVHGKLDDHPHGSNCYWCRFKKEASMPGQHLAMFATAQYPVPFWLAPAWHVHGSRRQVPERQWYAHVGSGENLRTAPGLPIVLSKRAAEFALNFPCLSHYQASATRAFRYGQLRSCDVDDLAALELACYTSLGRAPLGNETFWAEFAQWLGKAANRYGRTLTPDNNGRFELQLLVEFLWNATSSTPLGKKSFSLEGRNVESLTGNAYSWWHQQTLEPLLNKASKRRWTASGLAPWKCPVAEHRYVVVELTNHAELIEEGQAMEHCVAKYVELAETDVCRLFSLRTETEGPQRLLTIELDARMNRIVQIRGRHNRSPSAREMGIIRRWATEKKIGLENF